jgi:hypothetical protein
MGYILDLQVFLSGKLNAVFAWTIIPEDYRFNAV